MQTMVMLERPRWTHDAPDMPTPQPAIDGPTPRALTDDRPGRIRAALERARGNQGEAAKLLGVTRRTLINWLDRYGFPRPRKRQGQRS
jgi:DNA-binding NtrC family response regulator